MKSQILSTNVWVEHEWTDYKLKWEPEEYGGVTKLHVPSEQIWLPGKEKVGWCSKNLRILIIIITMHRYRAVQQC